MITPLIRSEGEIGEVVITALGLANPAAFRLVCHIMINVHVIFAAASFLNFY